ncbi:Retrovirus-related Pol poly from transposon [Labeo rohita]|uniref:Retrovirus-related Pol poly from transposon n=1 Tax=Labeo rohita TaxID=84645 RepID=A0A498NLX5_LABRO|nr:Retrovirus-related Pol poly from transposon [Labeo rohita]
MENTPVRSFNLLSEQEEQSRGVPRYGRDDRNLEGEKALEERVALIRTLSPTNPFRPLLMNECDKGHSLKTKPQSSTSFSGMSHSFSKHVRLASTPIAAARDPESLRCVDPELDVGGDQNIRYGALMADVDRNAVKQSRYTERKVDETFSVYPNDSSCQYNQPQTVEMPIEGGFVTDQCSLVGRHAAPKASPSKANSHYLNTSTYNVQRPSLLPPELTYKVANSHFTEPRDGVNKHSDQLLPNSLEQTPDPQLMLSMYPTTPPVPPCWVSKPLAKEAVTACCTFSGLSVPATSLQPERGGNKTRSCLKLGRYDGCSFYEAFQKKFELVAEVNGWDEVERVGQLAAALDGDAQQVLLDVQGSQVYSSQALHQALLRRFGDTTPPMALRQQFQEHTRRPKEPLGVFMADLRNLAQRSYPTFSDPSITEAHGRLLGQPILRTEELNTQRRTMGGEPQQAVKRVMPQPGLLGEL